MWLKKVEKNPKAKQIHISGRQYFLLEMLRTLHFYYECLGIKIVSLPSTVQETCISFFYVHFNEVNTFNFMSC